MTDRVRRFSLRIIRLSSALPKGRVGDTLGRQVLRCGTSVGANYCEAARASSKRHFVTTMEIAQREASETLYWLDLIGDAELVTTQRIAPLRQECQEILAILTAAIRTAKAKK